MPDMLTLLAWLAAGAFCAAALIGMYLCWPRWERPGELTEWDEE